MLLTYLSGEFGVLKLFIKMNISANTLFHFVSQRKFSKDILHGKLIPRYCVEHFEINDYLKGDVVIPMKCFCDIPLSQIYEHTNTYGKFAIGFTKEWAQKVGITPVIYIHNQSPQIQDILPKLGKNFFDFCNKNLAIKYIKPYYGKMWRNGKLTKDTCFYNEREWRFVPKNSQLLKKSTFEEKKDEYQNSLKTSPISFSPKDIKYIIIQEEKNRSKIINIIKKSNFFPDSDSKELAISKIFSVEHIHLDL